MRNFFSYDSKFSQVIMKIVDCFYASILWVIFSIPVVTIGASTTALFHVAHTTLNREGGYVLKTFLRGFKTNFKKATIMWLIQLVALAVLGYDIFIVRQLATQKAEFAVAYYIFYFLIFFVAVWILYTCAYNNRFELNIKGILKNSALLAAGYLPYSLVILLVFVASIVICYFAPFFALVLPAASFMLYDYILEKIFIKIMDPLDREQMNEQ